MTTATNTGPRLRWIVALVAVLSALRLVYVLRTLECFTSLDDGWIVQYVRDLAGQPMSAHLAALVDYDVLTFSGGTRFNIAPLALLGRWIEPTYGLVKASAVAWSSGVLLATLWAFQGRLRGPSTWLWVALFSVPAFPALLLAGRFTGNHQEIPLFMMVALGVGFRLSRARSINDGSGVRRWGVVLGLVLGFGIYYCQTFWLWVVVQGGWFLLDRRSTPGTTSLRELAWIGLGAIPGLLLCFFAYVPDHWQAIFLPYVDSMSPRQEIGEIKFDPSEIGPRLERIWPGLLGRPWLETSTLSAIGSSVLWIPLAWVSARRASGTLRVAVTLFSLFIGLLVTGAVVMGISEERHFAPIVPMFLFLQVLVLGQFIERGGGARVAIGLVAAAAVLAPRVNDMSAALPGTYTLSAAWHFPAEWLADLDVVALTESQVSALRPVLEPVYGADLAPTERLLLLRGIGEPFAGSAGVQGEKEQPFAHRRWNEAAWIDEEMIVGDGDEHSLRFQYLASQSLTDPITLEVIYYTGVALGSEVFGGIEGGPSLPQACMPCRSAVLLFGEKLWSPQVYQQLRASWSEVMTWPPSGRSVLGDRTREP